jgi:hypothetical protein
MGTGYVTEFLRSNDTCKPHEILDRVFIGSPCVSIAEIGKPFDTWRHLGQSMKLSEGQEALRRGDWGRELGVGVWVADMANLILKIGARAFSQHR